MDDSTSNTVGEYQYDGAKRQIVEKIYVSGVLDHTNHNYFSNPESWQILEVRVDSSTAAKEQIVWGLRYQDDQVVRDRDTSGTGSSSSSSSGTSNLNERLYALQDANWNMTAIADETGTVKERYAYTAYGSPMFMDPSFNTRTSSNFALRVLYAGYRWLSSAEFYQVRHRPYLQHLGLWPVRDPLGLSAGLNLYEYTRSNPLNTVDPEGTIPLLGAAALGCAPAIITVGAMGVAASGPCRQQFPNNNQAYINCLIDAMEQGIKNSPLATQVTLATSAFCCAALGAAGITWVCNSLGFYSNAICIALGTALLNEAK